MKFTHLPFSTDEVVGWLQRMEPKTATDKELREAAIQYVSSVMPRGRVDQSGSIRFSADESRQGHCAVCNSTALCYDDRSENEEGLSFPVNCEHCGSYGVEYEAKVFDGVLITNLSDMGRKILFAEKPAGGDEDEC